MPTPNIAVTMLILLSTCAAIADPIADPAVSADVPSFSVGSASGPQGRTWREIARLPDWSGAWGLDDQSFAKVVATSDGPAEIPPFTPAYVKKHRDNVADRHRGDVGGNNSANCLPDGMPNIMSVPFAFEFLFTPGRVTIIPENNEVRRIYTDGRSHNPDPDLSFEGDSIGYWDHNTLVVDTIALNPRAELFVGVKVTKHTHVIERIFRKDRSTLQIDTTVIDGIMFTRPYQYTRTYKFAPTGMMQVFCTENNRDTNNKVDLTPPPLDE